MHPVVAGTAPAPAAVWRNPAGLSVQRHDADRADQADARAARGASRCSLAFKFVSCHLSLATFLTPPADLGRARRCSRKGTAAMPPRIPGEIHPYIGEIYRPASGLAR